MTESALPTAAQSAPCAVWLWAEILAFRWLPEGRAVARVRYVHADRNDTPPQAWSADVIARIADMPVSRLPELLPWGWHPQKRQGQGCQTTALAEG